jgi:transposase
MGAERREYLADEKCSIGIDISQDYLDIAAYPSSQFWRHPNNRRGIIKTVAKLKALGPDLVVMEATGSLQKNLVRALHEAEVPVAVVNPKRIRDYGRSLGILAKTDKLDARVMAHFAAKIQPQAQTPRSKEEESLEDFVTRRAQLRDMLISERSRLKEHLDDAVKADIEEHLRWLSARVAALDKEIKGKVQQNQAFKEKDMLYQSMVGVGRVLSSTLIAKLPELGKLNQREIASLVGLAPMNRDSGKFRGKRMIRGGRAMVRKALYMPVLSAVRYNGPIHDLYTRLINKGKRQKVALTACMHKMITILNAMAKTNSPWDFSLKLCN